jgi:hypothetical protein
MVSQSIYLVELRNWLSTPTIEAKFRGDSKDNLDLICLLFFCIS